MFTMQTAELNLSSCSEIVSWVNASVALLVICYNPPVLLYDPDKSVRNSEFRAVSVFLFEVGLNFMYNKCGKVPLTLPNTRSK